MSSSESDQGRVVRGVSVSRQDLGWDWLLLIGLLWVTTGYGSWSFAVEFFFLLLLLLHLLHLHSARRERFYKCCDGGSRVGFDVCVCVCF